MINYWNLVQNALMSITNISLCNIIVGAPDVKSLDLSGPKNIWTQRIFNAIIIVVIIMNNIGKHSESIFADLWACHQIFDSCKKCLMLIKWNYKNVKEDF